MDLIYHIATAADWRRAQRGGDYVTSTIGRTLAEEGFIHASTATQVAGVANRYYRGVADDLVLLIIDPGRLRSPLRYEHVPGAGEPFPHIYGPLNADAVLAARPFPPDPDGTFTFPPDRARPVPDADGTSPLPPTRLTRARPVPDPDGTSPLPPTRRTRALTPAAPSPSPSPQPQPARPGPQAPVPKLITARGALTLSPGTPPSTGSPTRL